MKKIIYILLVVLIAFTGCEKYLDINQNPNDPTAANPSLVLPSVMQGIAQRYTVDMNADFSDWMGYWSYADGWSGWFDLKGYNITHGNFNGFFNTPYSAYIMDANFVDNNSSKPADANFKAIAKICKVLIYQPLVDAYGRVPYSKASVGNFYPTYDDGQTIYNSLLAQLDSAITLIRSNSLVAVRPSKSSDIMFAGDMTQWIQLANTLKLKLLVRESGVAAEQTNIKAKLAALKSDATGFITADVLVNPGYTAAKAQPFYATWGYSSSGSETDMRGQQVMNAFIYQNYRNNNDPRITACFNVSNSSAHELKGKPFGLEGDGVNNPYNKDNGCLIGGALISKDVTNVKGALILSLAEANFLIAEAIQLYPTDFNIGSSQTYYENAVRANFSYLSLTSAAADTYMAQALAQTNWATATDKKLLIRFQKYMALCGLNGFESWCEYRRTGVPDPQATQTWSMLSVYKGVSTRQIPNLLYLPQRELTLNTANANDAEKATGMNNTATGQWTSKVFWDVN